MAIYDEIVTIIRNAGTMIDLEELSPEENLRDLGADSLDVMSILLAIQEKYGIEIPDEDIDALTSIELIEKYISAHS